MTSNSSSGNVFDPTVTGSAGNNAFSPITSDTPGNDTLNSMTPASSGNNVFNPSSPRAREASFRRLFSKLEPILAILMVLALLGGAYLLFFQHSSLGWLFIGLSALPLMLIIWTERELKHIPVGRSDDINDLLSGDTILVLQKETDWARILARLLLETKSGRFLTVRLGLPAEMVSALFLSAPISTVPPTAPSNHSASDPSFSLSHTSSLPLASSPSSSLPPLDQSSSSLLSSSASSSSLFSAPSPSLPPTLSPETIFSAAREVRAQAGSRQISGGDLAIAIIKSLPSYEAVLKNFDLELSDLESTLRWFNYLYDLAENSRRPVRSGGIARDLNFGYIPTLQHYGQNISARAGRGARSQIHYTRRSEILEKMVQIFSSNAKQNIALIGPEGSGRSIAVRALAEELLDEDSKIPNSLKYRQIFQLDASALISAAGSARGNIERLLNKIFYEAYAAKNIILYFNDAQLFFRDGTGSLDLTNLLMPIIDAGNLRIILSIEEQEFLQLSARGSGIMNKFNRINVAPTNEEDTLRVLEDQVSSFEARFKVMYDYRALKEAYRLGDRYITDRSEPGRALRLLEIGAEYADNKIVTARSIQQAVENNLGVRIQVASGTVERERLLNMEELIHQRMVDQVGAVKTVSSALRRAAAGVRNPNRPIGTFLFLGPTGVGKTELAKAVSEVYFSGETEIARLDLNEFVRAEDVQRLIADASIDEKSLTAQISKRPFSVVLLDEIEKAHPQVLTALLQVLDEGILRDVKNQEVSFRDAIIIATSNAGANKIREYIEAGMALDKVKDELTNTLITSGEFKPEFLNRFDEICVFTPLSKTDLLKIVDLQLKSVNKNLAPQKITVELDEAGKALLVEKGYDPMLGARPMRRIIQKTVENLVAKAILAGATATGTTLKISASDVASELEGE